MPEFLAGIVHVIGSSDVVLCGVETDGATTSVCKSYVQH